MAPFRDAQTNYVHKYQSDSCVHLQVNRCTWHTWVAVPPPTQHTHTYTPTDTFDI